jgi:hypothetical protein
LKTQGGNTFWKNNSVTFVSTFLIGEAIHQFPFFLGCKIFVKGGGGSEF